MVIAPFFPTLIRSLSIDSTGFSAVRLLQTGTLTKQQAVLSRKLEKIVSSSTYLYYCNPLKLGLRFFSKFCLTAAYARSILVLEPALSIVLHFPHISQVLSFTYPFIETEYMYRLCGEHKWSGQPDSKKAPSSPGTPQSLTSSPCLYQILCTSEVNGIALKFLRYNMSQWLSRTGEHIPSTMKR